MILSFNIKNFKSILDLTLSTVFDEGKAPNGYKENSTIIFHEINNIRAYPVFSVYGANASGKSNIIEAFRTFFVLSVENGLEYIKYNPNKLNPLYNDTSFELEFLLNNKKYKYVIIYDSATIIKEALYCDKKVLYVCNDNVIKEFHSNNSLYDYKKITEIYKVECQNTDLKQTSTLLMKLGKNYANLNPDITSIYNYFINDINIFMYNRLCSKYSALQLLSIELGDENTALNKITSFIKKFDIDIENIFYELKNSKIDKYQFEEIISGDFVDFNKQTDEVRYSQFFTKHKDILNNYINFKMQEESAGTQTLISIIGVILAVLEKGGVLIVDELDRSIHPLLLIQLYKLFKDKRYNKKNAQMIFTLHCTDLLEDEYLRKSEVGIVTKTKKQGSTLRRLSEYSNLRNTSDFRKLYLNGEFAGIPYPYI